MADIRTTIEKTVMGNKRVHFGTCTMVNATTNGTIDTGLRKVESFICSPSTDYAASGGTVTVQFADPTESRVTGWMAIGY